jgi:hypothetical protein
MGYCCSAAVCRVSGRITREIAVTPSKHNPKKKEKEEEKSFFGKMAFFFLKPFLVIFNEFF